MMMMRMMIIMPMPAMTMVIKTISWMISINVVRVDAKAGG